MGQSHVVRVGWKMDDPQWANGGYSQHRRTAATWSRPLLALSERQPMTVSVLNITGIVVNIETILWRLMGECVTLIVRLCKELWLAKGGPL
ncbi:MAG: hypothetical protein NNA18_04950 [Nitrospira sp.]|nr:hypothetical protein [Nitrospira sp.]